MMTRHLDGEGEQPDPRGSSIEKPQLPANTDEPNPISLSEILALPIVITQWSQANANIQPPAIV
jgi:hypothetical protein